MRTDGHERPASGVTLHSASPAPFMPAILDRLAPILSAEILLEPEFRIAGLIRFANGRKSFFWHNKFNLNSVSAARIAQDKGYTSYFLRSFGYCIPESRTFFRDDFRKHLRAERGIAAARRYARELGWPVFLKPCRRSQGQGVAMVTSGREFDDAASRIFARDRVLIVQQACRGRDWRIVILDGDVLSAYERIPLSITGDGRLTVAELLAARQRVFDEQARDTRIPLNDSRIITTLQRSRLRMTSVLAAGRNLQLLDVANLSLGGTTSDITAQLHPTFAELAARITSDLDLRFAGIDLIAPDVTAPVKSYAVLEVNSAPGLDHYGSFGTEHEAHVDELYLRVLRAIERGPR